MVLNLTVESRIKRVFEVRASFMDTPATDPSLTSLPVPAWKTYFPTAAAA